MNSVNQLGHHPPRYDCAGVVVVETNSIDMEIDDLILSIRTRSQLYINENGHAVNFSDIACTVSTNNIRKIIDHHYSSVKEERPQNISTISIFGLRIFPSEFMSDTDILMGTLLKLNKTK